MSYAALARKAPVVSTSPARTVSLATGGLRFGEASYPYEQEADRAAGEVVTAAYPRHQWSFSSVPVGQAWLQRQPDPKLDAAAQKRLDTFTIDAKDLSNPLVTGQLRSMSNSNLVDYKNKVKDGDVKRFVETLLTFSTPLQTGAGVDPLSGDLTMQIGNVNVVVKPDVRGARVKTADTNATFAANPPRIPGYDTKDGVVVNFPDVKTTVTVEIVTSYETGVSPEATSGYGRGTTADDLRNKATSLRFHEGSHGEDFIDFVRKNPYPTFGGKSGMKVADFEKEKTAYNKAVSDWGKAFNKVKLQGDCVGKTVDEYHKGEKGYKNICP